MDGWLHTRNVASMDEDGCLFIVYRKKDMIFTAGFNVYPAEIERVFAGLPDVALVAVGSIPDEDKGERRNPNSGQSSFHMLSKRK
jgi:long-chain acyl-CoA synthetase